MAALGSSVMIPADLWVCVCVFVRVQNAAEIVDVAVIQFIF